MLNEPVDVGVTTDGNGGSEPEVVVVDNGTVLLAVVCANANVMYPLLLMNIVFSFTPLNVNANGSVIAAEFASVLITAPVWNTVPPASAVYAPELLAKVYPYVGFNNAET